MTATTMSAFPPERFVSKRDGWLVAVLWGASLVDVFVAAWLLLGSSQEPAFVAPLLLAAAFLQLQVLYATDYTLEGSELVIRAWLFRWRVPLLISPDDKRGFLRALAQRAPQLEVSGEGARRRG